MHGHAGVAGAATVVATACDATNPSMLPLSSAARLTIDAAPCAVGIHVYVQLSRPVAGCQVAPPSVETSTPATTPDGLLVVVPPPASAAVPLIVTGVPTCTGLEINVTVDVGAIVSLDALAARRPVIRLCGCTPMSANRFTVACCMRLSTVDATPS